MVVLVAVGIAAAAFFGGRASVDRSSPTPQSGSYAAGREDAFAGFDGGWAIGVPYAVTLERGGDGITYKFARRWAMEAGFEYRVCGHEVCSRPAP